MTAKGRRRRMYYERRIFLLALLAGLPGSAVALSMLWLGNFTPKVQWTLTVLIGGFAAAAAELTLATGAVQSAAQERAGVSIAWGEAVFEAYGYGQQPGEAFAATDAWLQVTGADLLLRWDCEDSDSSAGQAWAHSEIDYMAIDIHAWSPAQPTVIELEQAFALQALAADPGLSSYRSLNFAAVAAAVHAEGTDALALTSTHAFTDSQFSFVHAMALASL